MGSRGHTKKTKTKVRLVLLSQNFSASGQPPAAPLPPDTPCGPRVSWPSKPRPCHGGTSRPKACATFSALRPSEIENESPLRFPLARQRVSPPSPVARPRLLPRARHGSHADPASKRGRRGRRGQTGTIAHGTSARGARVFSMLTRLVSPTRCRHPFVGPSRANRVIPLTRPWRQATASAWL